ncbi:MULTISPECIES: hypothetical protein [Pseudomonas]|uniref:hypothetical protein n=1 Tax=Pseudomonas TaxID=286 RepID=UPI000A64C3B5|nr:hypothetical protein [Pseudomonas citronellolis]
MPAWQACFAGVSQAVNVFCACCSSLPRAVSSPVDARAYLRTMARGMCIDLWRWREVEQAWLDTLAA